ncbi:MAG: TonB-dependent receptor [Terracidiphilus sp.]
MKCKLWLALLSAVCLCWPISPAHAQQDLRASTAEVAPALNQSVRCAKGNPSATGRIAGVIKDQLGAVVPGVKIEALHLASGMTRSLAADNQGRFQFDGLPVGRYQVTAIAAGFEIVVIQEVLVTACGDATVNIVLKIAPARTVVEVNAPEIRAGTATSHLVNENDRARSRNAAELLGNMPGVSLRENGQLASIPFLHGLGDERAKIVVDGMTLSSACPNHMNPPLSYIASSNAAEITVMAGITPVSLGGDSIGGTVSVDAQPPVFAGPEEQLRAESASSGFYRSNGENYGGGFSEWIAGRYVGLGYSGSWATNTNYTDGSGHKITSAYAQSTDHTVTLAAQGAGNLLILEGGLHHTPYEGFVNAQMDLMRNNAESLNLHYRRNFDRGVLDAHIYWQGSWHSMNIGKDKSTFPMPMVMPMNTHGKDIGYTVKYEVPLSARHSLRAGNELHRFVLDDIWPAVAGTAPYMGPNPFVSINDGRRIRLGWFAEVASKWNPQWTTLFGLRDDTVWSNTGPVEGYSSNYAADADAFNALNRAHEDVDLDATALSRYEPSASSTYEFGYARKTRAPNLYERYAWSTSWMASGMIGWFGDGNYYVGNVALKLEIAHTVSGTATWRDRARKQWEMKLAPYLTFIQDYVDVDTLVTTTSVSMPTAPYNGMSTFAQLRFANHNARIYGGDLSGSDVLWSSARFGEGKIRGVASWLHGERLDTQTALYQMMPLNLRVAFDEELKGFDAGFGVQAVDRKSNVDPHRFEQITPGFALFNVHSSYQHGHLQAIISAENLLNKNYELPLGGVNFDDYMASGWMCQIRPLTGRGRSLFVGISARF